MSQSKDNLHAQLLSLDGAVRQMLAEDLPKQLADFRDRLASDDTQGAYEEVHAVHGSASFCGLIALRDAARKLETLLMHNKRDTQQERAFESCAQEVILALDC